MSKIHLCSISPDANFNNRIQSVANKIECQSCVFDSLDAFAEKEFTHPVNAIFFSAAEITDQSQIAGSVQVIKQFQPEAFVIVIVNKKINNESSIFIKKSGASLILAEPIIFETCIVEYLCSQTIRGSLVPIKANQLIAESVANFSVYAVMPLNQKILSVINPGSQLSKNKIEKLKTTSELYIKRDDISNFSKYLELNNDQSAEGLDSRCRIQFLDLARSHYDLIKLLVDQSEAASFTKGKELFEETKSLSKKLMTNLSCVQDPWKIVDNSSQASLLLTERSTSIAAMSGLIALQINKVSEDLVTTAALLCDIGLLLMPPDSLEFMQNGQIDRMNETQLKAYHNHPMASINMCLERKLPLDEKLKNIIAASHEQTNSKGFPKQLIADKIPLESQLIHFSLCVDSASQIKMGEAQKSTRQVRSEICKAETLNKTKFDLNLLLEIQKLDA